MSKMELLKARGNKCSKCGKVATVETMKDFHFHHLTSKTKIDNISNLYNSKALAKELKKTRVLCKECHKALHSKYGKMVTVKQSLEFINN